MPDDTYDGASWSSGEGDFIDGLDLTAPLACCCVEKPPLGLMRKSIYERARALDLLGAMRRYMDANKEIPEEWIQELRTLPPAEVGGKMELEAQVRLYNSSWGSIDAKKIGMRVIRFKEKRR